MGLRVTVLALLGCFFSTLLLAKVTNTAAEVVNVNTIPIFPKIRKAKMNKDFQALVRVEAPLTTEKSFAPIDLVVVFDVSSRVNDKAEPSRMDLLKKAIMFIIRELSDTDRLAIVMSNSRNLEAQNTGFLEISGDVGQIAREWLDRLQGNGGGAFLPGLERAVKILDERAGDAQKHAAGFVILLTDGEDSSGIKGSHIIHGALRRYPFHTMGLSAAHDPRALISVAQDSHGTYSFVDKMNLADITGALAVCLAGLKTVVAVDMHVTLCAAAGGVQIKGIDSGGHESYISGDETSGHIIVGALYANEVKSFVVHLHVPVAADDSRCDHHHIGVCDHHHVLTVGYSFSHAPGLPAVISADAHRLLVQRLEFDDAQAQHAPSPLVLQHIVQFELLDMVASLVRSEVVGRYSTDISLGSVLQTKWDKFRRVHQFWAGVDLSGMEKDVDAMVSSLQARSSGSSSSSGVLAYVYSWVSSYQMQRATTMGSPEKVTVEFLTPAMRLMLEEALKLPATFGDQYGQPSDDTTNSNTGRCLDFHKMDQRLRLWSKVKQQLPLLFEEEDAAGSHHTSVFQEASLEAIDRAMHHDIYLAVVHASNQRRCHFA